MSRDILVEQPQLFLGSRLKRLSDRLLADAARITRAAGLPIQPAHMSLLATIDQHGPMSVTELGEALGVSQPSVTRSVTKLIDLGLLAVSRSEGDLRLKTLAMTTAGTDVLARGKALVWPPVTAAVTEMCAGLRGSLVEQLAGLERELDAMSLAERVAKRPPGLSVLDYDDTLAGDFHRINAEWISAMFSLEDNDRAILSKPRETIIDRGGVILFVESPDLGIIGTCALL